MAGRKVGHEQSIDRSWLCPKGNDSDEAFAKTLGQSLGKTMETDGRRILADNCKQQPAGFRLLSWLSYGWLRLMMGISGYAREYIRDRNKKTPAE